MLATLATVFLLALTRAEMIARLKAPAVTQADGFVRVYASCPEDMRREYQMPIARFAADTATALGRGTGRKPPHFSSPALFITVGDARTNAADVIVRVSTNADARVITRLYVVSPGSADLGRLRAEVAKAYFRSVLGREASSDEALLAYHRADPRFRAAEERQKLEDWLAGVRTLDDEEGLRLMRRVFEPGRASPRDVLIFASRLYLYPPQQDVRFLGRYACLSFREALKLARTDSLVRLVALAKARDLHVFAGGKGEKMSEAADAYRTFLVAFAAGEDEPEALAARLEEADEKLNEALEKAKQP